MIKKSINPNSVGFYANTIGTIVHKLFNLFLISMALLVTLSVTVTGFLNPLTISILGIALTTYVVLSFVRKLSNYIYREYYIPHKLNKSGHTRIVGSHFFRHMSILCFILLLITPAIFFGWPIILPILVSKIGLYLIASLASIIAIQSIYSNNVFCDVWVNSFQESELKNGQIRQKSTSTNINDENNPFISINLYRLVLITFVALIFLTIFSNPFSTGIAAMVLISLAAIIALASFMKVNDKELNQVIGGNNYLSLFCIPRIMPKMFSSKEISFTPVDNRMTVSTELKTINGNQPYFDNTDREIDIETHSLDDSYIDCLELYSDEDDDSLNGDCLWMKYDGDYFTEPFYQKQLLIEKQNNNIFNDTAGVSYKNDNLDKEGFEETKRTFEIY